MYDNKQTFGFCEEVLDVNCDLLVYCGRRATVTVQWPSGEGPYNMCDMCGFHSVKNRGALFVKKEKEK